MVLHDHAHVSISSLGMGSNWTLHLSEPSLEGYFWIGIGIRLLGNTLSAVGLLLQKYAHKDGATAWYFTSSTWLWGFGIFIVAHILCWVSLALSPQAVLACLTCWSTMVCLMLAPVFLRETLTVFKLLSVCIMFCGCALVIWGGPRVCTVLTVPMLVSQSQNMLFLIQCCLALLYLLGCACVAVFSNERPRLSPLQYATVAAILGWYSVLCAKITSGLVFSSWHHQQNQFDQWEIWGILVTMIFLCVSSFHFLNMALSIGDVVYVVPIYEVMCICGQALVGGIFFQEFQHLDMYGHIAFWLGLSCILVGIAFLSCRGPQTAFFQYPILSSTAGKSQDSKLPLSPEA